MTGKSQDASLQTTIAPLLSVRKGAAAIDFYKSALGAREIFRIGEDDESIIARMSVEGALFWLADESPEHFNLSPESLGGSSVRLVLTVENPDALFERALNAGAKAVYPVADQPYGWRVGRLTDPFGHHWEIGKPLSPDS